MSERTIAKLKRLLALTEMYRNVQESIIDSADAEDFWYLMDEEDIQELQDILGEGFTINEISDLQLQVSETLSKLDTDNL